ncbi:MAG TPA: hypothetical protein VE954_28155 [Oligoflexus sp.]|uniref:hypothetical protein n=1 Tax=Oligoflexus sp. TaxID=1971216 RepID=UPI002D2C2355|nr:hypothetical protein [Oligoflexus sp.]HYX36992.1 hypothetical protein [Oligoflexus sp.]
MNVATRKNSAFILPSDKLRLHGWTMGLLLLVASLLVASSVTAVINFILLAIPILTIAAIVAIFMAGIPMVATGIQRNKEALARANAHEGAMVMGLEGFWKHARSWDNGHHPNFLGFQPVDHDIVIHLDSKSNDNSITMGEFMQMTSGGSKSRGRDVEKSLEGLTDWRRM